MQKSVLYQQQMIAVTAEFEIWLIVAAPFSLRLLRWQHYANNVDTEMV
jgi:hypothetical protein